MFVNSISISKKPPSMIFNFSKARKEERPHPTLLCFNAQKTSLNLFFNLEMRGKQQRSENQTQTLENSMKKYMHKLLKH